MSYDDVEECWKWRQDRFRRIMGPDFVNPFTNRRRKEIFKLIEKVIKYVDVRCEHDENGEYHIIMKPLDIEKYTQREAYEREGLDVSNHEETMIILHDRANNAIKDCAEKINKFNLPYLYY
ncbi:MAG: hypothetical protein IKA36_06820 [Clostridia bacterium]|nr:hypothetical protein [Clostridia bacterium]